MRHAYGQVLQYQPGDPYGPRDEIPGLRAPDPDYDQGKTLVPEPGGGKGDGRPDNGGGTLPAPNGQPNGNGTVPPNGQPNGNGTPAPPNGGTWPGDLRAALSANATKVAIAAGLLVGTGVVIGYFVGKGQTS